MTKKKYTRDDIADVLTIIAKNSTDEEYAKITSAMSMLFVGHTFDLSEDGFEFINLAIKIRKNKKNGLISLTKKDNIIKITPKK
jgi:hypothetical protein|tara:strand:+ start:2632 stop:2883 length:252 start_codon:yes stop_codon:yes gene_type:complete